MSVKTILHNRNTRSTLSEKLATGKCKWLRISVLKYYKLANIAMIKMLNFKLKQIVIRELR